MKLRYLTFVFFFLPVLLFSQVVNDEPCDALPLSCGVQINSTTAFALPDHVPFCGTGNGTGGGVWYTITPEDDTKIILSLCGTDDYDSRIRVFEGSCDSLVCVTGEDDDFQTCFSDDPEVEFVPLAEMTYYILVYGFGNDAGIFSLNVMCENDCPILGNIGDACDDGNPSTENDVVLPGCSCQGVAPPANDEPCSATLINCGVTLYNQSTVGATSTEADDCGGTGMGDVWYTFSTDGTQNYTFTIIDPEFVFDGVLELYQSDFCNALLLWEECTDGPESYTVSAQGTFFVKVRPYVEQETSVFGVNLTCTPFDCSGVGNIGDACNDGDINTTDDVLQEDCTCAGIPKPFNDKACNAINLDCGDVLEDVIIQGASPALLCSNFLSVWYTVQVDAGKTVELNYTSSRMVVYLADSCENPMVFISDCSGIGIIELTQEGTYLVEVVDSFSEFSSSNGFDLSINCFSLAENNEPCTATPLFCDTEQGIDFSGSNSSGIGICDTTDLDLWYSIELDNDTTVVDLDFFGIVKTEVFILEQDCTEPTPYNAECALDFSDIRLAGQGTFLIKVVGSFNTPMLSVSCSPRSLNDTPCGAITLECNESINGNFINASSNLTNTCSSFEYGDPDLWYQFTVEDGLEYSVSLEGDNVFTDFALWTGNCDSLVEVDLCDPIINNVVEPGNYFLQVLGRLNSENPFEIVLSCFNSESNNTCDEAIELSCGETLASNSFYFRSSVNLLTCETSNDQEEDAWYYFEGEAGAVYDIELLNGSNSFQQSGFWDGLFAIFRGDDCSESFFSLSELACVNEEITTFPGNESLTFTALETGRYYIRVLLDESNTDHRLRLSCTAPEIPECTLPYPAVESTSLTSVVNTNSVEVSWTPILGSIGCQVQGRPLGSAGLATLTNGGLNVSGLTIGGGALQPGITYEWRVRCGCSQNPLIVGPWSDFAEFTFGAGLIQASPNPTEGLSQVSFEISSNDQVRLEIIDMSGRLVETIYQGGAEANQRMSFQFDGGYLPNGIYLYRLYTSGEVLTEKLMIAR